MDCSLPGPSNHGIFQARVLEWGSITFSDLGLEGVHISETLHLTQKLEDSLNIFKISLFYLQCRLEESEIDPLCIREGGWVGKIIEH